MPRKDPQWSTLDELLDEYRDICHEDAGWSPEADKARRAIKDWIDDYVADIAREESEMRDL